ncbi:MAG: response regulator, partial [Candidatus Coatesbacteria bacterium]|nr:response regulator [Candidatus Coatesbacteria bacterium]
LALVALVFLIKRFGKGARVIEKPVQRFQPKRRTSPNYRELMNALPIPAFCASGDGRITSVNPEFSAMLGAKGITSAIDRKIADIFPELPVNSIMEFLDAVIAAGSARTNVLPDSSQDENVKMQLDGFSVGSDDEVRILVICSDKKREAQAKPGKKDKAPFNESYLASILNGLHEAIMVVRSDCVIVRVNRRFLDLVGRKSKDDVQGQHCDEIVGYLGDLCGKDRSACPVNEILKTSDSVSSIHEYTDSHGLKKLIEVFASPVDTPAGEREILISLKDVTKRSQMSAQIARADKLKALGEMASGVAHDFNNLLGVILGRTQMLIRMIGGEDAGTRRNLEIIERTALDGAETVRRIQEFTKIGDTSTFVPVNLNEIIEDSIGITKPRWKDQMQVQGIVISTEFDRCEIPHVAGKPSELRELFVNLINNSIDALTAGGVISIKTSSEKGMVHIRVSDNGEGIAPQIVNNIFDPFFTTREPTNSGLGLSIVMGIVERHGGSIEVKSEQGKRTEFHIQLPGLLDDVEHIVPLEAARPARAEGPSTSSRVLIIDDEADIRSLLVDMLAGEGHQVDIASSGEEGIEKCKSGSYDYVITDLGMPHMSGWEVAREVKSINPDTTVILATGWGIHFDDAKLKAAGINRIITKPFQVDEVLTCINGRHRHH